MHFIVCTGQTCLILYAGGYFLDLQANACAALTAAAALDDQLASSVAEACVRAAAVCSHLPATRHSCGAKACLLVLI